MTSNSLESQLLNRILEITRDLSATVSLESLLDKITQAAAALTDTESAGILLLDEPSGNLWFMTATHMAEKLARIPVPLEGSIAGAAFTSGAPVIVPDVDRDPRYYRAVEELIGVPARSLLAIPMQFQERRIGVLEVENKRGGGQFDPRDIETLEVLAAQAAIAIENARLVEGLNRQSQLAESLRQASVALSSTLNYNEVLNSILEQISTVIPNDAVNVMMLENDRETARVFQGRGYERYGTADTLTTTTINISRARILQRMQQTRQAIAIPQVERDPEWVYSRPEHTWIKSYVGAPIFIRDQIVGFLNLNSGVPGFFGPEQAERLQAFVGHAASAIENARLYQQAQQEISERTKAEAEVRRHRDHLEEMVEARVAEIKHINAELLQRNAELDAFAHTVAHDLKAPLVPLLGFSQMLIDLLGDTQDETAKICVDSILSGSNRLARIIDELLVLASVRRQADVRIELLNMAAIVREARERVAYLIKESDTEITLPKTWPSVVGQPAWIEEVWANYLSNAIKYGGHPPRIELGADLQPDRSGGARRFARFWVRDNGAGLTEEEQAQLFTEFTQLHQIRATGHGLGLSIVRRIVEKLGGQVGAESQPGHGSLFFFTLPMDV